MRAPLARLPRRSFPLAALLAAALCGGAAAAQEAGDSVVVVLRSGKKYSGTLVSRDDSKLKIRMGSTEVELPSSMVSRVEKVEPEPEPEPAGGGPAPAPSGEPAPAPAPSAGGGGPPKGASLVLKDGTVIEGYVVAKDGGRLWIVPGKAMEVSLDDVSESFGDVEPQGKGIVFTGNKKADARRMVKELGASESARISAAGAALDDMGQDAVPAILEGLQDTDPNIRGRCLGFVGKIRPPEAVPQLLLMVRSDSESSIRANVAGVLGAWDPPGGRRALLEATWRDPENSVKMVALSALAKVAGPEEASALIDLLNILPTDSPSRANLYSALKQATGLKLLDDAAIWIKWWDEGGREKMAEEAEKVAAERRRREDEARERAPMK
jgi:hypothetical protein